MKVTHWLLALLMLGSLVLAGCTPKETAPKGGDGQKAPVEKQYAIKGKVVDVNLAKPSVRLDHEEIKGLMKGMEMEFDVQDRKVLEGLRPGDQVHGHLKVTDGRSVIVHLEKHQADPAK